MGRSWCLDRISFFSRRELHNWETLNLFFLDLLHVKAFIELVPTTSPFPIYPHKAFQRVYICCSMYTCSPAQTEDLFSSTTLGTSWVEENKTLLFSYRNNP